MRYIARTCIPDTFSGAYGTERVCCAEQLAQADVLMAFPRLFSMGLDCQTLLNPCARRTTAPRSAPWAGGAE